MGSSAVFVDHYAALGLRPDASGEEIKKAFRRKALLHHPDTGAPDHLRFIEVHSAYRILMEPESRARYDREYLRYLQQSRKQPRPAVPARKIPPSRLVYPQSVAALARKGLLQKKFRVRDRRFFLEIDYDLELPLAPGELGIPLTLTIPLAARQTCPDCLGSDIQCGSCDGKGYRKTSAHVEITLQGGLLFDQIIEIDLSGIRPAPMTHFRKKKIRIKISKLTHSVHG